MADSNVLQIRDEVLKACAAAADIAAVETVRVDALGKKGRITELMKTMGALTPEERKAFGQQINTVKDEITTAIEAKKAQLESAALDTRLTREVLDVTLPVRPEARGSLHPISQTVDEMTAIFGAMGFEVAEGPDVEDDFHNFTALNFPPGHPAREMHDTFFLPPAEDGNRAIAAYPHVAGADPHHDEQEAADPRHHSRPHLPLRLRHDAHAHVSPDGIAGDR